MAPSLLPASLALSWSVTRHRLLAECERAVYWTYWGSRGAGLPANDPDAARDARQAWAFRHLTDLSLLVGVVVHRAARVVLTAIRSGKRPPTYRDLLSGARATMNQVWRGSQPDQIDKFWRWPGAYTALREIVVRGELRDAEVAVARARVRRCLAALLEAPLLEDLRGCGAADVVLPADDGPVDFTPLPGTTAWGAVDVAYRHHDVSVVHRALTAEAQRGDMDLPSWRNGPEERRAARAALRRLPGAATWTVADWKTTAQPNPDEERLQLGALAIWLETAGYPNSSGVYLGRIVDLVHRVDRWYVLDEDARDAVRAVITSDVARQRQLMADPELAIPLPRDAWALAVDQRRSCPRCRFRLLCHADKAPAGHHREPPEGERPAERRTE